jgi:excisionase family DNA binding protein
MPVELLNAQQVADQLRCKKTTVWIYAKERKIEVIVMGQHRWFTQEAVDKFIKEHTLPTRE